MAASTATSVKLFEPIFMDNPDYDRIVKIVYASYPNACVLMLDRVNNPELTARYEAAKAALGPDGVQEVQVYHGTKDERISAIAQNGFKISHNARSAYGRGTYFASQFVISKDYTNVDKDDISHMFICRLAMKDVALWNGSKAEASAADTFVNAVTNPTIYVARRDELCIPMYLVRFYRNAA